MNRTDIKKMGEYRRYKKSKSVIFAKTTAKYGAFSNMAPGMSLYVNDINIYSSEALYQACKFPLFPDIQEEVLSASNAMEAKLIARKYGKYVRQDWNSIKYKVMKWCLEVKYIQNKHLLSELFESTGEKPIVEYSKKDTDWGASPFGEDELVGTNALGRLLMELRQNIRDEFIRDCVCPPDITGFLLLGHEIGDVFSSEYYLEDDYEGK